MQKKICLALVTSVIDGREARGTALVAREYLARLLTRTDEFEFTLIHHEPSDEAMYGTHPTLLIPHLPGLLDRQMVREAVFWIRLWLSGTRFDIAHYLNPRIWPSYLLTPSRVILLQAYEAGIMLDLSVPSFATRVFRFTNRYLHQRMTRVVATSAFGRQEIAETFHLPLSRVAALPLGVHERFTPISHTESSRKRLSSYDIQQPYILSVSRLDPHKNILRLIEAFSLLHASHPDLSLVLVGGRHLPEYSDQVLSLIKEKGLTEAVHLAPFIPEEDLPLVYSHAEVFVYPSLHEGFGLPLVEAMASGTPIATANTTACPETAGEAALLFDPYRPEEIAERLQTLINSPDTRSVLRERGLARAKRFTWEQATDALVALYRSLI